MCVEQIGGGKVLYKEGAQPGIVMTYSGGMGGEEGGAICVIMADSHCSMTDRNQYNIVKQISYN